jgi:hypothetical protein
MSNKSAQDLVSHKNCRLGQWYDTNGMQKYSGLGSFRSLDQPHAEVHNEGVKALEAFANRNQGQTIMALQKMENASQRVMGYLDDIANFRQA